MAFSRAKEYLKNLGFEDKIIEFNVSSATVLEAALALDCTEGEIAKTLAFNIKDKPVLIVMAGNVKVDNAKFKQEFGVKAQMININDVENLIGHQVGGVCPFGIKDGIDVYLDNSLKQFKTVYPACGSSNSAVKLLIEELEIASNYLKWIDVSRMLDN